MNYQPHKQFVLGRWTVLALCIGVSAIVATLISPSAAHAEFGIASFDGENLDASGNTFTQAGGHPDTVTTSFAINTTTASDGHPQVDGGNIKTAIVGIPAGLVGNPQVVPRCEAADFYTSVTAAAIPDCPNNTVVGYMLLNVLLGGGSGVSPAQVPIPIFNLDPGPNSPARFGAGVLTTPIVFDASVRTGGDYGLDIASRQTSQGLQVTGATINFWGVPADPSHDSMRNQCAIFGGSCSAGIPARPFLRMPTSCEGPQTTTMKMDSWTDPGTYEYASFVSHDTTGEPVGVTGCDGLDFSPSTAVVPTTTAADSPAGLTVRIDVPQNDLVGGLGEADLKTAVVELPPGMAVNTSSAGGLAGCAESQIALDSDAPARCPDASKIGSMEIDTPLLDKTLKGGVYLAEQGNKPGHGSNPFDSLLALYMVAEGQGVVVKLSGKVEPDENTGRLKATFDENPQLPFSELRVQFKSGPRAPLATPSSCGIYKTTAELTPWSGGASATQTSTFTIDKGPDGGPCEAGDPNQPGDPADLADRPFHPDMTSGVMNPVAGSFSPFIFRLTRQDGEQEILSTEVTPPEGVTGKLAGIPLCSNDDAQAGTCDQSSKVGEVIAGAGAGPTPFYIQGDDAGSVYLSGPYKGAPLSLQIQVPAIAGPFDLGMVNVRAAMHVDKRTAQLHVISDPIPQILEGIPLRVKDLRIRMNREAFTIAPTNCDPMQVQGVAHGVNGAEADLQNRFQVGDCAHLDFSPKLRLNYRGKGSKRRNSHPRLAANLRIPGADSVANGDGATQTNIKKVRVVLPKGTFLDQDALSRVCTPTQWEAEDCPEDSKIGNARAWSPILDEPLKGPVYLKVGPNELPDLAADLNGIVPIDLFGKIDQSKGRIRNTFQVVPDVPVEKFRMNIRGGNGGLLVNSRDICGGRKALRRANVAMSAHNGDRLKDKQSVVRCGKKRRKSRR